MFNLLEGWRNYYKRPDIVIFNPVFRIHSTFTKVMLITFCVIITWTQFVGKPIRCILSGVQDDDVLTKFMNTYCWITYTFTVPDAFDRPSQAKAVPYPGIANDYDDKSSHKYYTYYQWVCFVLFFQALLFHFPEWLWATWERNLMKTIVEGLNVGLRTEEEMNKKKAVVIEYLIRHLNLHNFYSFRYWFCELLCFVNVVFQMFVMNWFLSGDFITYGLDVLSFVDQDQEQRSDHFRLVFPRVTKCTFRRYGPSASIEKLDAMCIMPLNIVNERIYIFLWLWFIVLAILTGFVVMFRGMVIFLPSLRPNLMHARNRMVPAAAVESVSKRVSVSDWWLLYMLAKNMDPQIYTELIVEFAKKIDTKTSNKQL